MAQPRYDIAQALAAAWRLGVGDVPMPVSGQRLDYAVGENMHLFPERLREELLVSHGRCLEMPDILDAAEYAMLIQTNGSDFLTARVLADEGMARRMALEVGLSTAEATALGKALRASIERFDGPALSAA